MRDELSDYEWTAIKPMLPNKPRGVRRLNDRRVLNGIFWVLRSGAPLARHARDLWSPHHLLQSLRSVAAGWRLGPDHGCAGRRS
jgi:transposase